MYMFLIHRKKQVGCYRNLEKEEDWIKRLWRELRIFIRGVRRSSLLLII